jgi:hypothetical protein
MRDAPRIGDEHREREQLPRQALVGQRQGKQEKKHARDDLRLFRRVCEGKS